MCHNGQNSYISRIKTLTATSKKENRTNYREKKWTNEQDLATNTGC